MRYQHDSNQLYIYILISLFLHLLIFILIPYGVFSVMGNSPEGIEYGFIQLVEYRVEEVGTGRQIREDYDTGPNIPVEEKKEDKVISEEKIVPEEKEESEVKEVLPPTEATREETPDVEEFVKDPEPIREEIAEKLVEESTRIEEGSEILTSAESDLEIEIDIESNETQKQVTDTPPVVEEKIETTPPPPPPPPPPSAGELLLGVVPIAYPKDLVGQAVTGSVEIQVHISSSGLIEGIEIVNSSGIEQMDRVARLTIEHGWQFKQYQQPYSMTINVEFLIDEAGNPDVKVSQGNLIFR